MIIVPSNVGAATLILNQQLGTVTTYSPGFTFGSQKIRVTIDRNNNVFATNQMDSVVSRISSSNYSSVAQSFTLDSGFVAMDVTACKTQDKVFVRTTYPRIWGIDSTYTGTFDTANALSVSTTYVFMVVQLRCPSGRSGKIKVSPNDKMILWADDNSTDGTAVFAGRFGNMRTNNKQYFGSSNYGWGDERFGINPTGGSAVDLQYPTSFDFTPDNLKLWHCVYRNDGFLSRFTVTQGASNANDSYGYTSAGDWRYDSTPNDFYNAPVSSLGYPADIVMSPTGPYFVLVNSIWGRIATYSSTGTYSSQYIAGGITSTDRGYRTRYYDLTNAGRGSSAFSPDGKFFYIAHGGSNNRVLVFDTSAFGVDTYYYVTDPLVTPTGGLVASISVPHSAQSLAISPDGTRMAVGSGGPGVGKVTTFGLGPMA